MPPSKRKLTPPSPAADAAAPLPEAGSQPTTGAPPRLHLGTSGYAYPEWRGRFYPAGLKPAQFLAHYIQSFGAVELNHTFYRLPSEAQLRSLGQQLPADFALAVKLPLGLTHRKDQSELAALADEACTRLRALGAPLRCLYAQLPAHAKADRTRLDALLHALTPSAAGTPLAIELVHPSWEPELAHSWLAPHGVERVLSDRDEAPCPPEQLARGVRPLAYVRLRRSEYTEPELEAWAEALWTCGARDLHVYFRHEDQARGPALALRLAACWRRLGARA